MSWSPWLTNLGDTLADLYPDTKDARRLATQAGVETGTIDLEGSPVVKWFAILNEVENSIGEHEGNAPQTMAILERALQDHPQHKLLLALQRDEPPIVKGTALNWVDAGDGDHYEKITGEQSTLLPIRFLEIGTMRARSVARIVRGDRSSGTGFLIGGGWLLTNNHVVPSAEVAFRAVAEFNYQQMADDADAPVDPYPLDPTRFHTNVENDWTAVGISPEAAAKWGVIALQPTDVAVDAYVNIIQHPGGGPKQIGMYHNTVSYAGQGRVQYLTDTLPGSSGAPVFDCDWQVIALHHSGGVVREPGTKKMVYRNEGIAITTVIEELRAAGVLA
jgi:V8-like Glu-specific endopeptidase